MSNNAVKKYKDALAALHANQAKEKAAGITHETEEYQRLNRAANEAAKDVPKWRQ